MSYIKRFVVIVSAVLAVVIGLFSIPLLASATAPVNVGKGCTTVYYIDKDCDGYGVGKKSSGVYPLGSGVAFQPGTYTLGDMPDADDNDAAVNTPASWLAKWGSGNQGLVNFLGQRKSFNNASRIFYVSQSGDNATAVVNDPTHPYRTVAPILYKMQADKLGGAIVVRGGIWTDLTFKPCSYSEGNPCWNVSGTAANPIYIMAYPGERVLTNDDWNSVTYAPFPNVGYVTMDGLSWRADTYALGDAISLTDTNNMTIINNEFAGWHQTAFGNHTEDVLIKDNVFHDLSYHTIYFLYCCGMQNNTAPGEDFDFALDAINYTNKTSPGASYRGQIIDNVMYNNGLNGYEPIHVNTYSKGVVVDGNIVSYSGGTAVGFYRGTFNAVIRNNVFFDNGRDGITLYLNDKGLPYDSSNLGWITIENNTIYMGKVTDAIRNTNPAGGILAADTSTYYPRKMHDMTIRNNIFVTDNYSTLWGAVPFFFRKNTTPDTWVIENNILWNNSTAVTPSASDRVMIVESGAGGTISAGNYTFNQFQGLSSKYRNNQYVDPKLVSASQTFTLTPELFNLRLLAGSPAINAGIGTLTTDIIGRTRDSSVDIGAYEYSALTGTPPTVTLTASPTSITAGQSSILAWTSTGATSCSGIGTATTGTITVSPTATTAYVITCTGTGGSATQTATVTVDSTPPPPPTTPLITNISITGPFTQTNTCSTLTTIGGNCSFTVLFKPTSSGAKTGTLTFKDETDGTTHTVPLSGTGTETTVVTPTASLSANPTSIESGQSSTLTWSSTNATSCTGTGFSTGGATSGSITLIPSQTTTYSITCDGATASATVTVSGGTIPSPSTELSQGLAGYWKLDGDANDSSGNDNHGTLINTPVFVTGQIGQAVSFPGDASKYVQIGNKSTLNNQTFTMSAWVNPASLSKQIGIISGGNGAPGLRITSSGVALMADNSKTICIGASTLLQAGSWVLVTVTHDSTSNVVRLYANGTDITPSASCAAHAFSFTQANWKIGTNVFYPFNGYIDDVRIYNRALSASEVSQLYTAGQSGQVAWLHLPQVAGASTAGILDALQQIITKLTNVVRVVFGGSFPSANVAAVTLSQTSLDFGSVNVGESSTKSLTITVSTTVSAPTVSLTASPTSITSGQSSTLTWVSTNATSCTGVGFTPTGVNGSITVAPTVTTTYSINCSGATALATVTLSQPSITSFTIGSRVQTTANLNVRDKANTNAGKILCTQPAGSLGTLTSGPTGQQGYTWWQVNFDTLCDGYSVQDYLGLQ